MEIHIWIRHKSVVYLFKRNFSYENLTSSFFSQISSGSFYKGNYRDKSDIKQLSMKRLSKQLEISIKFWEESLVLDLARGLEILS